MRVLSCSSGLYENASAGPSGFAPEIEISWAIGFKVIFSMGFTFQSSYARLRGVFSVAHNGSLAFY